MLAARGLTNHQISRRLSISEATVKRHLSNVYGKMSVSSRMQAAKQALSDNWITIEQIIEEVESGPDHR